MTDYYWQKDAACRGRWELFDAVELEDGTDTYPHKAEAKALCDVCPVITYCRKARIDEVTGFWANREAGGRK